MMVVDRVENVCRPCLRNEKTDCCAFDRIYYDDDARRLRRFHQREPPDSERIYNTFMYEIVRVYHLYKIEIACVWKFLCAWWMCMGKRSKSMRVRGGMYAILLIRIWIRNRERGNGFPDFYFAFIKINVNRLLLLRLRNNNLDRRSVFSVWRREYYYIICRVESENRVISFNRFFPRAPPGLRQSITRCAGAESWQ